MTDHEDIDHTGITGVGAPVLELDYTEFTAGVSISATSEATANTVVTAGAEVFDGSTVIDIEFFSPEARAGFDVAGRTLHLWLYDGSSSIGRISRVVGPSTTAVNRPVYAVRRLTPSAASHTYSIRGSVDASTGNVGGGAGGAGNSVPGFIRIRKVI